MRRVVVTGMAAISTLGETQEEMMQSLRARKNATRLMEGWDEYQGLRSHLYAPLPNYVPPADFTRKQMRTMSTLSVMSVDCTRRSLVDAGLLGDPVISSSRGMDIWAIPSVPARLCSC